MKLLFIVFSYLKSGNGISKKIESQVKALKNSGLDVELCHYADIEGIRYWAVDGTPIAKIGKGIKAYIGYLTYFRPVLQYVKKRNIDYIYLRYVHNANPFFNRFLRNLKRSVDKIFLEIPTFPYDGEYHTINWYFKPIIGLEHHCRKSFHKYIDKIVTFSCDKEIFNVPTINISNAVDFDAINLQNKDKSKESIVFTGVANLMFWHGFDRFINSMKIYYSRTPEIEVFFNIVGDGPLLQGLKDLTLQSGLQKYIKFHGLLSGKALDSVLNSTDICIGCLACHRKGITEVKSLKNVEYSARGIPFIYSEKNDDFDNRSFVYKISPDDSSFSIAKIIDWYSTLKIGPEDIRNSVKYLSWDNQMNIIATEFKSH